MKKLLATLLAIVMAFGSFSMVSFAAEEVPAEKEGLNVTDVVVALVGLIKGKEADSEFTVGEVVNAVIDIAKGESGVEINVGELIDTVLPILLEKDEEAFEIADILDIIQAVANGEGDFNGDGVLNVDDLLALIEEKVSAGGEQDEETKMIVSIVFTVIKVVFKLISKFFAA